MASNFRIAVSRNSVKNTLLKLSGDFDGTSAYGLIHLLQDNLQPNGRIVIDTDGLRNVYSYGLNLFRTLSGPLKKQKHTIHFTGVYENRFASE